MNLCTIEEFMDIQINQEAIIHRILPFVILAVKVIIHIVECATVRFQQHPWGMEVICEGKLIFFNLEIGCGPPVPQARRGSRPSPGSGFVYRKIKKNSAKFKSKLYPE